MMITVMVTSISTATLTLNQLCQSLSSNDEKPLACLRVATAITKCSNVMTCLRQMRQYFMNSLSKTHKRNKTSMRFFLLSFKSMGVAMIAVVVIAGASIKIHLTKTKDKINFFVVHFKDMYNAMQQRIVA
uniref:Uncharacterized protein n=1 Tax=Glossina pallidipes TaxID=7398 RepID=A0A1B0A451_GLOPL